MLEDAQRAVVLAVVAAPEAWSRAEDLALAFGPEVVTALIGLGWLDLWQRPDYTAITLTPIAAVRLKVRIVEHWATAPKDKDDPSPGRCVAEMPGWRDESTPERAVKLPRHAHEVELPFPELVPDHRPGPELLIDEVSEEPVRLFQDALRPRGVTVVIDRRIRGRKAKRG